MKAPNIVLLVLGSLSALAVSGCAHQAMTGGPSVPRTETPLQIIDAHTHSRFNGNREKTSGIPMTRDQYFKEMQNAGITGGVAHTGENGEDYEDLRAYNVVTCAGTGARVNVKRIEEGLKRKKFGCIKIYLGYVHQFAFDKNYEPAY